MEKIVTVKWLLCLKMYIKCHYIFDYSSWAPSPLLSQTVYPEHSL